MAGAVRRRPERRLWGARTRETGRLTVSDDTGAEEMSHTCRGEALGRWLCGSKKYRIFSSFPRIGPRSDRTAYADARTRTATAPCTTAPPPDAQRHVSLSGMYSTRPGTQLVTTRRPAPRKYDFDAVRPGVRPRHLVVRLNHCVARRGHVSSCGPNVGQAQVKSQAPWDSRQLLSRLHLDPRAISRIKESGAAPHRRCPQGAIRQVVRSVWRRV